MADRVLANSKITIHWNTSVKEAIGGDWLEKIRINSPNSINKEIKVKGLFYAIGHTPNTSFLEKKISIDDKGYIICNPGRPETSLEGIFAAIIWVCLRSGRLWIQPIRAAEGGAWVVSSRAA